MSSFVQLSLEEYERLRKRASQQDIPTDVRRIYLGESINAKATIRIDMRKLKLQICEQNGIDPNNSIVEFY